MKNTLINQYIIDIILNLKEIIFYVDVLNVEKSFNLIFI